MNIQAALHELKLKKSDHPDEIHRAYRQLVKRWHPDQFAHQPEIHSQAEEKLKRINQAYATLNEYLNKKNISHSNSIHKKPDKKPPEHGAKSFEPHPFRWVKDWFRAAFAKEFPKASNRGGSGVPHNRPESSSDAGQTGFETVLRKACNTKERRSVDAHPAIRRSRPVPHLYRRRSKSTRIEGFRPASPVTPVRPVSKIDPIEGSD